LCALTAAIAPFTAIIRMTARFSRYAQVGDSLHRSCA
jgi:hypothetical protein